MEKKQYFMAVFNKSIDYLYIKSTSEEKICIQTFPLKRDNLGEGLSEKNSFEISEETFFHLFEVFGNANISVLTL